MTARARILVLGAIVLTLIVVGGAERLTAQARQAAVPSPAQIRTSPQSAVPGAPVWSPTGTYFAYREGGELKIYDVASHAARV